MAMSRAWALGRRAWLGLRAWVELRPPELRQLVLLALGLPERRRAFLRSGELPMEALRACQPGRNWPV
ncbi:MAG: hypothetical protein WA213_15195, partial [Terriglobales bacterium]